MLKFVLILCSIWQLLVVLVAVQAQLICKDMQKNKVTPVRGLVARPQQQCVTDSRDSLRDLHNVTEPAGKPLKMEGDLNISEKQ